MIKTNSIPPDVALCLIEQSNEIQSLFKDWSANLPFDYYTSDLDCSTIHDTDWSEPKGVNPVTGKPIEGFFVPIKDDFNRYPCLYYFEILNDDIPSSAIRSKYLHAQRDDKGKGRAFSAMKASYDENSRVLYVGKVKSHIGGRQIVHLGLYRLGATAGLQLGLWAKDLGLKLRLHFFVARDHNLGDYMGALEYRLAQKLKPLIGKHK